MTFTLKKGKCPQIRINNIIHQKEQEKYLGLTLDNKLTWKPHLLAKRKQLELSVRFEVSTAVTMMIIISQKMIIIN
jgi:hypothetical protein